MSKTMARGFVFENEAGNGHFQLGKRGIENVAVSNGREVVLTDVNGYYLLPIEEGDFLFISKPDGYELPLDEFNQARYFYLYAPNGTPAGAGVEYEPLPPTGLLPDLINFPLIRSRRLENFQALIFGDIQPERPEEIAYFRELIGAEMARQQAEFMMPLGDLSWDKLDLYPQVREALGSVGHRFYPVIGNHDINFRPLDPRYSRETYKRYFGPTYYSFNYGRVHFVVLDDIGYQGWNPETDSRGDTEGYVDERQLQWLANDLQFVPDDQLVFLCSHIPIFTNIASEIPYRNITNRAALFEVLRERKHLFHVCAHTHWVEQVDLRDGGWMGEAPFYSLIAGAACGAWWKGPKDERGFPVRLAMDGVPNGYFRFRFEGNRFQLNFCQSDTAECSQMGIRLSELPPGAELAAEVVANIYRASPRAQVFCRINGGPALPMERSVREDPYVVDFVARNQDHYPHWVIARPVAHLWAAALPEPLPPGSHHIEIAATEPDGFHIREGIFLEVGQKNPLAEIIKG